MTRDEWDMIVAMMAATWPHSPPEDATIDKSFADLEDLPAEQVRVAMETIHLDGERFPPTAGQIRKRVAELDSDQIDFGEAWRLAKSASYKADATEAATWLRERSPEAQAAVEALCGGRQLAFMLDDEPTVRAQFRDVFRNIQARVVRAKTYAALPSANLAALGAGGKLRKFGAGVLSAPKQIPETADDDG